MKILRIKVNGLPLYKNQFDISFYAVQRVQSNHLNSVFNLFGNIYVNTVEAFAGINAAGKTTALKVISFTNMVSKIFQDPFCSFRVDFIPDDPDPVPAGYDLHEQSFFDLFDILVELPKDFFHFLRR